MEKAHKDILIRLRKNIIDDLDVNNDIIQPLRNEYILREEDVKDIYIGATKEERASNLLDILPRYVYTHIHTYIYIYIYILFYSLFYSYTHYAKSYIFYFNVIALTNDTSNYISQVI